jgi:hypothetical protein
VDGEDGDVKKWIVGADGVRGVCRMCDSFYRDLLGWSKMNAVVVW